MRFYGRRLRLGPLPRKKELGQYPAIFRHLEGHGFKSYRGLRFFLGPTFVLHYFHIYIYRAHASCNFTISHLSSSHLVLNTSRPQDCSVTCISMYSFTSSNTFFFQCVKFHQNCTYLATASTDQTCRLWDLQSGNCVRLFTGHKVLEQE